MIKFVIFDFGGTLDTDGVHWSEKFWEFYSKHNLLEDKKVFEQAYIISQKEINDNVVQKDMTFKETIHLQISSQFKYLNDYKLKNNNLIIDKLTEEIYFDVKEQINKNKELLTKLFINKKSAIVSNFNGNLAIVCKEFEIDNLFNYLVDSAIINLWKPDPAIFQYAINLAEVSPEETIIIGDSYSRDIVPAKMLGCKTIWLENKSWETPDDNSNADFVINSLENLYNLFKENNL
jgi:putative hydrolase of the HAD superfamily